MMAEPQQGQIWTYEDWANPRREYEVIGPWGINDVALRALDTGELSYSDMRQAGWQIVGEGETS